MSTQITAFDREADHLADSSLHHLRLAGVEIDSRLLLRFSESFKAFNLVAEPVAINSANGRGTKRIRACVLPLKRSAVTTLHRCGWFSPRRTLLYGIGNWGCAAQFSELGINALLEKATDLSFHAAVSATHAVIGRGIGQHARVPIVAHVRIESDGIVTRGISRNLGPGGMAVTLSKNISLPKAVKLEFSLPGVGQLSLIASPRWYSGLLVGLCYEPSPNEKVLRKWIKQYSQLGK